MNTGAPMIAVSTETGISDGLRLRAAVSTKIINTAPKLTEAAKSLKGYGLSKSFKGQYGSDYFKTIANVKKLEKIIDELKDKGIWIVGTDMTDSVSYNSIDYDMPVAVIIGSEGFS